MLRDARTQTLSLILAKADPSNESGSQVAGLALLLYSVAQLSSCAAASTWTSEPANRAYRWGAVRSGSRTVLKHNFLGLLRRPAISGAVLAGSSLYQRERLTSAITQSADFASTAVACAMTSRSPSRPIRAGQAGHITRIISNHFSRRCLNRRGRL